MRPLVLVLVLVLEPKYWYLGSTDTFITSILLVAKRIISANCKGVNYSPIPDSFCFNLRMVDSYLPCKKLVFNIFSLEAWHAV